MWCPGSPLPASGPCAPVYWLSVWLRGIPVCVGRWRGSAPDATFVAQVKVIIHNAAPNTTFTVTRAADGPADGVCTSTAFAPVATLTTSAGGAGAEEFKRAGPALNFDLVLRVLGDDGSVLQSECMVIIGK